MSDSSSQTTWLTEYGIPIRNLWHMLLYAWNEISLETQWAMADVERAPTLDALLASVLMKLMQGRCGSDWEGITSRMKER